MAKDLSIGMHVSIAKQIDLAVDRALEIGCVGTFQVFTSSPRRWAASKIDPLQAGLFRRKAKDQMYSTVAHMPYMPNLSSPDKDFYDQSVEVISREVRRCVELGIGMLVLHFGSTQGGPVAEGHERVIAACRKAIDATAGSDVRLLLETAAGRGDSVGSKFEFLKQVLDGIGNRKRAGVCFDTCHVFTSGYEMRNKKGVSETISEFDRIVGLANLYLVHLNDSKGDFEDGSDRHEHIGLGKIGSEGFKALLGMEALKNTPFILETPIDGVRDAKGDLDFSKKLAGI